jgi:hypothetical protein
MDQIGLKGGETDPRFPSGAWTGFFWQRMLPGRNPMKIQLDFRDGELKARGTDVVGPFTFSGSYDRTDGECRWTKQYLGKHQVAYKGVSKGQGIWGAWEISLLRGLYRDRGVFHIWPEGATPANDVDLTEDAFLTKAPDRNLIKTVIGAGLLAGLYLLILYIRHLFRSW